MATTGDLSKREKQTDGLTQRGARDGRGFSVIDADDTRVVADEKQIVQKGVVAVVLCVAVNKQEREGKQGRWDESLKPRLAARVHGIPRNAVFSTIRGDIDTVATPGDAEGSGGGRQRKLSEWRAETANVEEEKGGIAGIAGIAGSSKKPTVKEERRGNGLEGDCEKEVIGQLSVRGISALERGSISTRDEPIHPIHVSRWVERSR